MCVAMRRVREETAETFLLPMIIVDEVEMAVHLVEHNEFGKHLRGCLRPWHPPVKFDDIAKLAGEGAASQVRTEIKIVFKFEQVETRHWRLGDVGLELGRCKDAPMGAALQAADELVDNTFGLTDHLKVGCTVDVRLEVGSGPPTTTGLPHKRQSSISRSVWARYCGNIPP